MGDLVVKKRPYANNAGVQLGASVIELQKK